MPKNALAIASVPNQSLQKSKPRYTEAENDMLFESWWNPQKRRELVNRLGRKMSALRSQFCRLLKEKGLSNQEYYNTMQAKYTQETGIAPRKRSREIKEIDRMILETFCKHQALGNSRAEACEELQQKLGGSFSPAALKLRFYRLVKRFQYNDEDLLNIGKKITNIASRSDRSDGSSVPAKAAAVSPVVELTELKAEPALPKLTPIPEPMNSSNSFLYQLASLPTAVAKLEERFSKIEESQRHQLDLRGFIEHLLAVERDLKKEDKLMQELQHYMDENETLRNATEKERLRIKKREEELSEVYKMFNSMLTDFMRLESVSKLASLGDFMHRLEITVDQFGNVLKSKRVSYGGE